MARDHAFDAPFLAGIPDLDCSYRPILAARLLAGRRAEPLQPGIARPGSAMLPARRDRLAEYPAILRPGPCPCRHHAVVMGHAYLDPVRRILDARADMAGKPCLPVLYTGFAAGTGFLFRLPADIHHEKTKGDIMNPAMQKCLWAFLAIAIVIGAVWQFFPLANAQDRLNDVPLSGQGFNGQIIPMTEFERGFFKGVNVVKRVYKVGEENFFLTILDGTNNRHVVHDPYYCFEGSGWKITAQKTLDIPGGKADLLSISKEGMDREAIFWFSDGTERYISPLHYWTQATLRRLSLGFSGPEPVLIMIQPLDEKTVDWNQALKALGPVLKV